MLEVPFDYIIGFDFGHGETSVASVDVSKMSDKFDTIPVEDVRISQNGEEAKIISIVGYDEQGQKEIDIDVYDFELFENIAAYFKGPLISSDRFPAITEQQKRDYKNFVQLVYEKLQSNPQNANLLNKRVRYFVACPSGWTKDQRTSYLDFFKNECGLPISNVVEESRAAYVMARKQLYALNPKLTRSDKRIAVLDFGSSTLDITIHADKTYTYGYEIGASQIEELLLAYFLDTDKTFAENFEKYEQRHQNCKQEILLLLRKSKEIYFNKQKKYHNRDIGYSCQITWEELANDIDGSSVLKATSSTLKMIIERPDKQGITYSSKIHESIKDFIKRYGKADAVVLTGGASQMSFYEKIVLDAFGLTSGECVIDAFPSYSISRGTAIIGYMDSMLSSVGYVEDKMPKELDELLENLTSIINEVVLHDYISAYVTQSSDVINEWRNRNGEKTIENLYGNIGNLFDSWSRQYEKLSKKINTQISEKISERVNEVLANVIRLYFGFDAQIDKIKLGYEYNLNVPIEEYRQLYRLLYRIFKEEVRKDGSPSIWREPNSLKKDRQNNPRLVGRICDRLISCIEKFFNGYSIGDDTFADIASDCDKKIKDFYAETMKKITCQI